MPNIIDTLIVKLGLDSKDLDTKGLVAGKRLNEIEASGKKASKSVDNLAASVGKFLAILGGTVALRAFIEDTIASSAALDRLSKNLAVSVENISAWGQAVEQLGGSAKGLQGTMSMLSQSQTELRLTGESKLIPYFSALGVALTQVNGQARPVDELLLDLSDRLSRMDRPTANNLGHLMGIDQDTLNLLLLGRHEVELTIKRQKEHSAVTKAQAEESAKLQKSIVGLRQEFTAMGRTLLQQASPALEKLLGMLSSFAGWIQSNREFIGDFAKILGAVAAGFALISLAASPITLTVAAIVALAAGIALLWQDYQTWKKGGDSLINWGRWSKEINWAKEGIEGLRRVAVAAFEAIRTTVGVGVDLVNGNWKGAKDRIASGVGQMTHTLGLDKLNVPKAGFEIPEAALAVGKIEGFNAAGSKPNRPQRNHNPGDIEYGSFAKAHGATGSDGRFAVFPDDQTGFAALTALLSSQKYAGLTVAQAIGKYAPSSENNTGKYIADFDRMTGAKPTDTMSSVLGGVRGAASGLAGAGGGRGGGGSNDHSVSVQTGPVTIVTQATDASGIARDWLKSFNYAFTAQANSGLN